MLKSDVLLLFLIFGRFGGLPRVRYLTLNAWEEKEEPLCSASQTLSGPGSEAALSQVLALGAVGFPHGTRSSPFCFYSPPSSVN